LGHQWGAAIYSRTGLNNRGCPYCRNYKVLTGYNDLATTHPGLAAQADGWDPTTIIAGSNEVLTWIDSFGHRWKANCTSRAFGGNGCPICVNLVVLAGDNDLATTHPDLAAQADGWDPTTVVAGTSKRRDWICENGHHWTAMVVSRSRGHGCPECANYGFSEVSEAYIYLMRHDAWGLLQVGITNSSERRVREHSRSGWKLLDQRGPLAGEIAHNWERCILSSLVRRGVVLGPVQVAGNFNGYTESWIEEDLPILKIHELMDFVFQDENQDIN